MGDEMHMRNAVAMGLLARQLSAPLAVVVADRDQLQAILSFVTATTASSSWCGRCARRRRLRDRSAAESPASRSSNSEQFASVIASAL
jgi:hypothetical protein